MHGLSQYSEMVIQRLGHVTVAVGHLVAAIAFLLTPLGMTNEGKMPVGWMSIGYKASRSIL